MPSRTVNITFKVNATTTQLDKLITRVDAISKSIKTLNSSATSASAATNKITKLADAFDHLNNVTKGTSASITKIGKAYSTLSTATAKSATSTTAVAKSYTSLASLTAKVSRALTDQGSLYDKLQRTQQESSRAAKELQDAEENLNRIMKQGETSAGSKSMALERYNSALSRARAAQKNFIDLEKEMVRQQTKVGQIGMEIAGRKNQTMMTLTDPNLNLSVEAVDRLNAEYTQLVRLTPAVSSAMRQFTTISTQQKTALSAVAQTVQQAITGRAGLANYYEMMNKASQGAQLASSLISKAFNVSAASTMQAIQRLQRSVTALQSIFSVISKVASAMSRVFAAPFKAAFSAASTVLSTFGKTASAVFAGIQRAINGVSNTVRTFSSSLQEHMRNSTASIQRFYNAGWSLLTAGYTTRRTGNALLGGVFGNLGEFMDYEKALTRTAISASSFDGGQVNTNPRLIEDLIFALQRGTYGTPVKSFGASDLAQGLYFYASALGKEITKDNMAQVGGVISSIMQLASVTQTSLETTTKGVINVATEFGIDPRNDSNAKAVQQIAAQMGYLANISTMEVPDIAETFKMLGPMAHILSGNQAGAGLNEMMALTYFASEVGLRGGNVGRGIGQALTTLLDPTDAVVETASKAFGIGMSKEAFHAFFFDAKGQLKGGLAGLFKTLSRVPQEEQAQFLAELFTQNATRGAVGILAAIRQAGGIEELYKKANELGGENPMKWLSQAALAANDTIYGSFQYLKNAWFAFQAELIRSVQGPLKKTFDTLGDFIWKLGDVFHKNKWIGEFVAGLATLIGVILSVVGTLFMFSGSILLVFKAMSMLGGLFAPSIFFFLTMAQALAVLVPLFVGIGAAVVLLRHLWETNFNGIQDRVKELTARAQTFFNLLADNGPYIARAFANVFEAKTLQGFNDLQDKLAKNKELVDKLREAFRSLVSGFMTGVTAALVSFAAGVVKLAEGLLKGVEALKTFAESILHVKITLDNFAYVAGVVLGGVFAAMIVRHFMPATVAILAFRAAVLITTAATYALSAAITVVNTLISVLTAVVAALTGVLDIAALLPAAFIVLIGVLVYLIATSDAVRSNLMSIAAAVWDGLKPAFEMIAAIGYVAFAALTKIVEDATKTIAAHREGVENLAFVLGASIAIGVGVAVGAFVLLIATIAKVAEALSVAFDTDTGLGSFIEQVRSDIALLIDALSFGDFNSGDFKAILTARIGQMIDLMGIAIFSGIRDLLNGISEMTAKYTGLQWAFSLIGVDFDPKLGKAVEGAIQTYKDRYNYFGEQIEQIKSDVNERIAAKKTITNIQITPEGIPVSYQTIGGVVQTPDLVKKLNPVQQIMDMVKSGNISATDIIDAITSGFSSGQGIDSVMSTVLSSLGFSSDALKKSGYTKFLTDLTKMTSSTKDDVVAEYTRLKETWTNYEKMVANVGKKRADAFYAANQEPIPSDPGAYEDWTAQQEEALNATENELLSKIAEMNKSITDAIRSVDLAGALAGAYNTGGHITAGAGLFPYADTIIKNAGSPSWLNPTELLADIAGTGSLGMDITGVNVHEALRPAFEILAEQTGIAISDLMKDVPKYIVPDEYVPLATENLLSSLNTIPRELYTKLDLLGKGDYTQFGLDWSELVNYAIGQGMAGKKWNLVDYVASTWDISRADAEKYIKDHQLDPNIVSDAMFPDMQLLINSMGGSINVLNEEWYKFLMDATNEGADKTIEITQAAFDQLPDIVKIGFNNMGYTFIVGSSGVANNIATSYQALETRLETTYGGWGTWVKDILTKPDGIDNMTRWVDETGAKWVTLTDTLGHTVTIPAPEYDAYKSALEDLYNITDPVIKQHEHLRELILGGKNGTVDVKPLGTGSWGRSSAYQNFFGDQPAPVPDVTVPGMPSLDDATTQGTAIGNAVLAGITTAVTTVTDFTAFDSLFTGYATSAAAKFQETLQTELWAKLDPMSGATGGSASGAQGPTSGPFDAMFKTYADAAATAFATEVGTKLGALVYEGGILQTSQGPSLADAKPFDAAFKAYATSAVASFRTEVTTQLAGFAGELLATGQTLGFYLGAGLAAGIRSTIPLVLSAATEMTSAAKSATQTDLALHSPSRVFMEYGENVGAGFAMGIQQSSDEGVNAMRSVIGAISGAGLNDAVPVYNTATNVERETTQSEDSGVTVVIENLHISRDVDVRKALDTVTRELGKKIELDKRGMTALSHT